MLADCVARELPNEEQLVEISVWSERMKNNKAHKWEKERFVFQLVEVFREGGWIFCLKQRYKKIYYAMYLKRQKFSLRDGFEG
jgi:hypothetical protein